MGDAISIPTAPRLGSNFTIGISNLMVGAIGMVAHPCNELRKRLLRRQEGNQMPPPFFDYPINHGLILTALGTETGFDRYSY